MLNLRFFTTACTVFIAVIISCNRKEQAAVDIRGNWVLYRIDDHIVNGYRALSIKKDAVYTVSGIGPTRLGDYKINNDSLVITSDHGGKYIYKIDKWSNDSLILVDDESKEVYYNGLLDFDSSLRLKSIDLKTRDCPEICPEFHLIVSGAGEAIFNCTKNCVGSKETKVRFDIDDWHRLDSLFKYSKIAKIDTTDIYQAMDNWPMDIEFIYNDGVKVKIRGTEDAMPYRIKPIISILIERVRSENVLPSY